MQSTCAMVKSRYIGDGHPTFNRNPYNGYINPYYWVDDHPLLCGNNGSLDPGTHHKCSVRSLGQVRTAQMPTISLGVSQDYHIFRPLPTNEQQKYTGLMLPRILIKPWIFSYEEFICIHGLGVFPHHPKTD